MFGDEKAAAFEDPSQGGQGGQGASRRVGVGGACDAGLGTACFVTGAFGCDPKTSGLGRHPILPALARARAHTRARVSVFALLLWFASLGGGAVLRRRARRSIWCWAAATRRRPSTSGPQRQRAACALSLAHICCALARLKHPYVQWPHFAVCVCSSVVDYLFLPVRRC